MQKMMQNLVTRNTKDNTFGHDTSIPVCLQTR